MKHLIGKIRSNISFVIITILVILVAFICSFAEYIGKNPFASVYYQDTPVQSLFSENANVYVIDSSSVIEVTDSENNLKYMIYGGDYDNSFDIVDSVMAYNNDIYVIDSSYDDGGTYAYSQRVLKFSKNGKKREVLYALDTANEDGVQVAYLDSPIVFDGKIYFSEILDDGVYVRDEAGEVVGFMPLEAANDIVADSTFDENFNVSVVMMNGDAYTYTDGELKQIFNAREKDTDEYRSLVSEIVYGNGKLYLNDSGQRCVYSVYNDKISTFIGRATFMGGSYEGIAEYPIYSKMNYSDGNITLVLTTYEYVDDESDYMYDTVVKNEVGQVVYLGNSIGLSTSFRVTLIMVYIAIILFGLITIYSIIKIIAIVKKAKNEGSYTQLLVLATSLIITVGVSYSIFQSCNERFMNVSTENLVNIAYLVEADLDKEYLASIDSPDAYFEEGYSELADGIESVLYSEMNKGSDIYAVVYKAYNNVLCEVYRNDGMHGVMYPMAGTFEDSIEQNISESGECYVSGAAQLVDGSYTFALLPSYDENGEFIGLIEIGKDYYYFANENSALYKKILIVSAMAVIIIMLMFGELMNTRAAIMGKRKALAQKKLYPPEVIRPITFLIFFTPNITTAFLPIYGMSLWKDNFPVAAEVAAAFPLSVEYITAAVSALLCGMLVKKMPIKLMCALGGIFFALGNGLSAFAPNLWVLILANSMCGIGEGLFAVSMNTFIAGYEDEADCNKGFIHYNAAILAGMNCGTVVGSLIWDNVGIFAAYMTAVGCAILTIFLSMSLLDKRKPVSDEEEEGSSSIKDFITPNIIKYFAFLLVPYLICSGFLSYYFPIVAEDNSLSAVEISMAFLISGVISIYTGSVIGEVIINHLGARKTMLLASFIYAAALFYLVSNPSILSCYVVIVLFAAADSFGFAAQSSYFVACPEVVKYGQGRALGIASTVESVASACGTVIFGGALLLGTQRGILLIAVVFFGLMLLFVLGGRNAKTDKSSEDGHTGAEETLV